MKRYFNFSVILIVVTSSLLASCELLNIKPKPKLPPITSEGKNTFGCRVNGKVWLPEKSWRGPAFGIQFVDNIWLNVNADGEGSGIRLLRFDQLV
jgi:hypothetical protein